MVEENRRVTPKTAPTSGTARLRHRNPTAYWGAVFLAGVLLAAPVAAVLSIIFS